MHIAHNKCLNEFRCQALNVPGILKIIGAQVPLIGSQQL